MIAYVVHKDFGYVVYDFVLVKVVFRITTSNQSVDLNTCHKTTISVAVPFLPRHSISRIPK
jgi:hypothetical protein